MGIKCYPRLMNYCNLVWALWTLEWKDRLSFLIIMYYNTLLALHCIFFLESPSNDHTFSVMVYPWCELGYWTQVLLDPILNLQESPKGQSERHLCTTHWSNNTTKAPKLDVSSFIPFIFNKISCSFSKFILLGQPRTAGPNLAGDPKLDIFTE